MYYRVVMQGRTLGGADALDVKREFLRVTGLPDSFAEHLFDGMPQVIKRQVSQPDAERIAATLRAIGAAATVERELIAAEHAASEGIRIVATPLGGPPSIIPGMAPPPAEPVAPARGARWLRGVRDKLPWLAGGILVVGGVLLAAPHLDSFFADLRPGRTPAPAAKPKAPAESASGAAAAAAVNPTLLHGPWRCVDQDTGTSTYWTYDADGTLIDHGVAFKEAGRSGAPMTWKVEGRRLVHASGPQARAAYAVTDLTLMRLRYGNEKGVDIQCRRP
jgi:hypothetical protein